MYAKNVSAQQLKSVALDLDFVAITEDEPDRGRVKFRLVNHSPDFHVVTDRATYRSKVCYHGHYEFLESLFQTYPDAVVSASWYKVVKYDKINFHELAEEVGDTVIRQFDQLRVRDRCECEAR